MKKIQFLNRNWEIIFSTYTNGELKIELYRSGHRDEITISGPEAYRRKSRECYFKFPRIAIRYEPHKTEVYFELVKLGIIENPPPPTRYYFPEREAVLTPVWQKRIIRELVKKHLWKNNKPSARPKWAAKTVLINARECTLHFSRYSNDSIRLSYRHKDGPMRVATINAERIYTGKRNYRKSFGYPKIVLKNFGKRNEGITHDLYITGVTSLGFVVPTTREEDRDICYASLTPRWRKIVTKRLGL